MAIIDPTVEKIEVKEKDLRIEWFSGTGCGGSNRNKKQNSCRITHIPTGIIVTSQTRDRTNSLRLAKQEIILRVQEQCKRNAAFNLAIDRKSQVGSGMRGDKIRTIRFQNNMVVDHRSGEKMLADRYMDGYMDQLWN